MRLMLLPHGPTISYSRFHELRKMIAAEEGINLDEMRGFTRGPEAKSWDDVDTTLRIFLHHSDCDGSIGSENCAAMLPRLKEIQTKWADSDVGSFYTGALDALIRTFEAGYAEFE